MFTKLTSSVLLAQNTIICRRYKIGHIAVRSLFSGKHARIGYSPSESCELSVNRYKRSHVCWISNRARELIIHSILNASRCVGTHEWEDHCQPLPMRIPIAKNQSRD